MTDERKPLPPVTECHCGAPCEYADREGECWGEVHLRDESMDQETGIVTQVHACQGHSELSEGGAYRLPDTDELADYGL